MSTAPSWTIAREDEMSAALSERRAESIFDSHFKKSIIGMEGPSGDEELEQNFDVDMAGEFSLPFPAPRAAPRYDPIRSEETIAEEIKMCWAVAKAFFDGRSLVEDHISSYNNFVQQGIHEMFREAKPFVIDLPNDDSAFKKKVVVNFSGVELSCKPDVEEDDRRIDARRSDTDANEPSSSGVDKGKGKAEEVDELGRGKMSWFTNEDPLSSNLGGSSSHSLWGPNVVHTVALGGSSWQGQMQCATAGGEDFVNERSVVMVYREGGRNERSAAHWEDKIVEEYGVWGSKSGMRGGRWGGGAECSAHCAMCVYTHCTVHERLYSACRGKSFGRDRLERDAETHRDVAAEDVHYSFVGPKHHHRSRRHQPLKIHSESNMEKHFLNIETIVLEYRNPNQDGSSSICAQSTTEIFQRDRLYARCKTRVGNASVV